MVLLLISISPCIAEKAVEDFLNNPEAAELGFWYDLIGSAEGTFTEKLKAAGYSFTASDIQPHLLDSRASRIVYFSSAEQDAAGMRLNGLTVWFVGAKVSQLRFDRNAAGSLCGLAIGSAEAEVLHLCGKPWIEDQGSLYYNLPWRGAPVRLRFVFDGTANGSRRDRLAEVYLYQVR